MSGGSYDYVYSKVQNFAETIRPVKDRAVNAKRQKFADLLELVADAMRAVEWVDSNDNGPGDEVVAIDKVFAFLEQPKP